VPGDHSLRDAGAVATAVGNWLSRLAVIGPVRARQ
jgi:hypothetical protein